jgi:hypothetical protein
MARRNSMSNVNGKQRATPRVEVPVNPNDGWHEIMALAGQSWGRGADATEARSVLRRNTTMPVAKYMIVPKGAWIDDMGRMVEWKLDEAGDIHKDGACPLCTIE